MANVGTAYVSVVPTMKGAASAITKQLGGVNVSGVGNKIGSQLTDGISKGTNGLSGKMTALAGVIGGVTASITSSLIGAIASLGSEMVEAADGAQKFASTLSFAGIDTSTIEKLTASTQEYADKTVYDLNDIRNATSQLAANGVKNYAQLAEAAGNLNAVAGGNAETFKSVSMVMSQTAGSGKLMTENWNQITDAIPGASGALQEAMRSAGAFEGNFREAMENGEISADEFFAAVQKLGMQDVAVQAATSTSTIEGALGNLKASVVGVGAQVVTALTPLATGVMTKLSDAISQIPGLFSKVTDAAKPVIQPIIDSFSQMGAKLSPIVSSLGSSLVGLFTGLSPLIQPVIGYFTQWYATIAQIAGQVGAVLIPILTQVVNFISQQIVPVAVPAIMSVFSAVQTTMPAIQSVISLALSAIQAAWNTVWPLLQTVLIPIFGAISATIQGAMTAIQGIINVILGVINGDWSQVMSGLQQIASGVWNAISAIVSGVMGAVQGFISSALSAIQGIWNSAWNSISSFLSSVLDGIVDAVSSGIDGVISFFVDLPGNILSAIGDLGGLLYSAGQDLINGLSNGIMSAIDGVVSAVTSGVDSVISAAKGLLGIASPSKVFAEIGDYTMQGFAEGIEKSRALASDAMRSAMGDVYGVGSNGARSMRYANAGAGGASTTNNIYIDGAALNGSPQLMEAFEAFMGALTRTYGMGVV